MMDQTGNFYYDGDEIQDYNKEAEERQHLKKAAILVNEWIQLLQQQPTRPQRPASPSFTVSTPSMTAAGDAKAWKLGGQLYPSERKQMTALLDLQKGNFAFSVEDLGGFKGEPMEVPLTTEKPIFNHAHKLGKTEWEFVGANCDKLAKQGLIRPSDQSKYAAATVVVRKRDENGTY